MTVKAQQYPWMLAPARRLLQDMARLPHALLLTGPYGLGKTAFAAHMAEMLFCGHPDSAALSVCGQCQNCRLLAAGTHPDLQWVAPAEAGKAIIIDQIRALAEFLHLRPHIGLRKIVVFAPAEAMNTNAANALLKLLEEPPPDSLLMLVSSDPARLPGTVRSRCQRLTFPLPARDEALAWLRTAEGFPGGEAELLLDLAGGAPLRALELAREGFLPVRNDLLADLEALGNGKTDPVSCAARWKAHGTRRCLEWLEGGVMDLIRGSMAGSPGTRTNPDLRERLHVLQKRLDLNQLFRFLETVTGGRRLLGGPLDELLLVEDILIRWTRLARQK